MKQTLLAFAALLPLLCYAQPANDDCSGAVNIPVNWGLEATQFATGSLNNATHGTVWVCGTSPYNDVWYYFTPTHATHRIRITNITCVSTLNYEIRSGSCTGETLLCGNSAMPDYFTTYSFPEGQDYYIRVYSQTEAVPNDTTFRISITSGYSTIVTNNTQYTTQQLVEDVFAAEPGLIITNITASTGINFSPDEPNGIAYFEEGDASFFFSKGIVLSTGNALDAAGPNSSLQNAGTSAWPGDTALEEHMEIAGLPIESINATSLEFDFVSQDNQMEFDFIYASEEYGQPGCSFNDRCAILLTDMETGVVTNLAVVPLTNVPLYGGSIHPYTAGCPQENIIWFSELNPEGFGTTNFNGETLYMEVGADVEAGALYHLKIVIADGTGTGVDSALFLEGGSLELSDFMQPAPYIPFTYPYAMCEADTDGFTEFDLQWAYTYFSLESYPGEYTFTYYETLADAQAGTGPITSPYTNTTPFAQTIYAKVCQAGSAACTIVPLTLQVQNAPTGNFTDYYICDDDNDGIALFDLTTQTQALYGPDASTFYIFYFETEEDANFGSNPIANPQAYSNITNPQTLFVSGESVAGETCGTYVTLTLHVMPGAPMGQATQTFVPGETLASLEVEGQNLQWYADADATQPLPYTTVLQEGATYYVSQTINGSPCGMLAITVSSTNGLDGHSLAGFEYYPNPALNQLALEYTGTLLSATLYNAMGQEVLTQHIGAATSTLNLEGLAKGVYLMEVEAETGKQMVKIIKL